MFGAMSTQYAALFAVHTRRRSHTRTDVKSIIVLSCNYARPVALPSVSSGVKLLFIEIKLFEIYRWLK